MANVRKANRNKYTSICRVLLQDSTLSFECRGLIAYLLSKPDDWSCRISDIEREGKIGRTERRRIMLEAEKAGYLTYISQRNKSGKFDDTYEVHEEPVAVSERTDSSRVKPPVDSPPADLPYAGFPHPAEPHPENPHSTEEREIQNRESQKKERTLAPNGAAHFELLSHLTTRCGKFRDGGAQGTAVKWLLDNSFSVEQCKGCLDSQLSEGWRKGRVSWLSVATDIGNWLRKNPKWQISSEVEKVWQKMLGELREGLGCEECETVGGRGNYPFGKGYLGFPYGSGANHKEYPCKTCNPKLESHPKHSVYLEMLELQKGGASFGTVQRQN